MSEQQPDQPPLEEQRLTLEERRLALEERRAAFEEENRRVDRQAEERNRSEDRILREKELANSARGITAPQATAVAAIVGLIGAAAGAAVTGYFTKTSNVGVAQQNASGAIDLEKEKFETGLILKAVQTNTPQSAVPVLRFYAQAGLIPEYEKKILDLADQNGGASIIVSPLPDATDVSSVLTASVVSACQNAFDQYKTDTAGFVRAVANQFGVALEGDPDQIIVEIQQPGWEKLADGVAAAARARAGYLVIGGLKGSAQAAPSRLSQVVVVVDGPLAAGKFPSAYWGNASGNPGKFRTINWAWSGADRDHVIYAARPLNVSAAH